MRRYGAGRIESDFLARRLSDSIERSSGSGSGDRGTGLGDGVARERNWRTGGGAIRTGRRRCSKRTSWRAFASRLAAPRRPRLSLRFGYAPRPLPFECGKWTRVRGRIIGRTRWESGVEGYEYLYLYRPVASHM